MEGCRSTVAGVVAMCHFAFAPHPCLSHFPFSSSLLLRDGLPKTAMALNFCLRLCFLETQAKTLFRLTPNITHIMLSVNIHFSSLLPTRSKLIIILTLKNIPHAEHCTRKKYEQNFAFKLQILGLTDSQWSERGVSEKERPGILSKEAGFLSSVSGSFSWILFTESKPTLVVPCARQTRHSPAHCPPSRVKTKDMNRPSQGRVVGAFVQHILTAMAVLKRATHFRQVEKGSCKDTHRK